MDNMTSTRKTTKDAQTDHEWTSQIVCLRHTNISYDNIFIIMNQPTLIQLISLLLSNPFFNILTCPLSQFSLFNLKTDFLNKTNKMAVAMSVWCAGLHFSASLHSFRASEKTICSVPLLKASSEPFRILNRKR